ncbi:TonB-linked SusC/RagA family outer membrane protein [Arcticibacter pallidicorallinus]|uniref:TonB-linked SusC/RagA family outer membrane protein n=1 Tax=Arcticibacter pallidicorallinus TaxID=1259464 RepID=A0A2T0UBB3_9SPHI|nr:TonB-dependent receptor [Arcticibacter pallidicorallinus]PRY55230.1 TonB-linked SusC/RagA family outer membrane protein [Arcticibacter pallidicorallinus]
MKLFYLLRSRLLSALLLTTLLLLKSYSASAQQSRISGRVIEAGTSEPLPGVSVTIKGSTNGTLTDVDGRYNIQVSSNEDVLRFTFIGFETKEVPARQASAVIELKQANNTLNEVVVVAYGTANRSNFTGSVSSIKGDQLEKRPVSNIGRALQGVAPGIQSTAQSGQPGTDATIRIRGIGSVNASSAPLYVVDGNPFSGDLASINPNDIASVSVLKDAASSALYGSRGANGVIIITTKQGKRSGETRVGANFSQGFSSRAVKDYNHLSTNEYFELTWEAIRNNQLANGVSAASAAETASRSLVPSLSINPYGSAFPQPVGTDGKIVSGATPLWNDSWVDELTRVGKRTQADINFSGGNDKSQYYISGGYLNDEGMAIGSGFKRYNARVNVSTQAKKWLSAGLNISAANSKQDYPQSEDTQTSNVINFSRIVANFYPVYKRNADGSYLLDPITNNRVLDYGEYRPSAASPRTNLVGTVGLDKSEISKDNLSGRAFLEATFLPELKLRTTYSADLTNQNDHYYINPSFGEGAATQGSVTRSNYRTLSYTINNILTYDKRFNDDHHLNLLAGQEFYSFNRKQISGSRARFAFPDFYEPDAASQLNSFNGYSDQYALLSFLGRAEYDYKNRYFFSGSLRTDGSSRFSPSARWGTFWSLGASWKASEEAFLKNQSWLDLLTLRASYGGQGNDNLGIYYAYEGLYAVSNNLGENGVVTSRLATPDLKWETNLNLNVGLDISVLNNRLGATFEFFSRRSKDLLFKQPKAPSIGYSSIDANIGSLQNNGFEVQLNTVPVLSKNFRWGLDVNLTHYKNKITALPQQFVDNGNKRLTVGGSIYDFYLKEWAGVNPETGSPQWYFTDANNNKVVTTQYGMATSYIGKSALPDFFGGITNTFRLFDFELSALLAYSVGGYVLDRDYVLVLHNGNSPGRAWGKEMLNRWTPENRNTDVPALSTTANNWNSLSTRFLYDASYARLKNVSLRYHLPKSIIDRLNISDLSVSLIGENLLTFYGHQGMDPEQVVDGTTYFRYPAIKSVSAGIQLTF